MLSHYLGQKWKSGFLAVNSYLMLLYLTAFQRQGKMSWVLGQTALSSEVQVRYCCSLQEEKKKPNNECFSMREFH